MCKAIEIMKEDKRKAEAETRQVRAELKERTREKKLLIKMLKESGRSEAEIDSYIKSAFLASA